MTQFFVTVWLKGDDSEKDLKKTSQTIRQVAREMSISIDDDMKMSKGGGRITIRGIIEDSNPEATLESFTNGLEERVGRKAKGRFLK